MIFYAFVIIATILSFFSALAILSAVVISGRSEQSDETQPVRKDMFPALKIGAKAFDEATLKRLADTI